MPSAEKASKDKDTGERDEAPRHTEKEWRQVSVSARECLSASKCAYGEECFAERAREKAQRSHLIITNHSLLAIDAIEGIPMIPEYDAVVIDERFVRSKLARARARLAQAPAGARPEATAALRDATLLLDSALFHDANRTLNEAAAVLGGGAPR